VALDDVARGDCAMATAKFAEIDAALTSSPEEAALRARGLILPISGALTQHAAYFDAGAPAQGSLSLPVWAIYRGTGHPSSCRPRHTDRVVGWWSEEPRLTARIRRRHTTAALSAVRAVHKSDFRTAGNAHQISV